MKHDGNIAQASLSPDIDPRSVPKVMIDWPVAFRLKPANLPESNSFTAMGKNVEGLRALKNLTSPAARHGSGAVPLPLDVPPGTSRSVVSAFAGSLPEWRFATREMAHMVLAASIPAAIAVAIEIYGQFMRDTSQSASTLSFQVERFHLKGKFADVADEELFPACYDLTDSTVSQRLASSLNVQGEDGLVFETGSGLAAIVLAPKLISRAGVERALALEWNGENFHRVYDYRDMYWRNL